MTVQASRPVPTGSVSDRTAAPVPARSVPLRVWIEDGEAMDSWMEALARRNNVTTRRLLSALTLPASLTAARGLVQDVEKGTLRRIEQVSGLPPHRLDRAVLDHYAPLGWAPLSGSRYCPPCLADTGGRWLLRWRLPWVHACTKHQTLLLGRCPACGRPPRRHLAAGASLNPPGSCPNGTGGRYQTCRAHLAEVPADLLEDGDPILATQRWIEERLDAFDTGQSTPIAELRDVHVFGDWIGASAQWRARVAGIPRPRGLGHQGGQRLCVLHPREAGPVLTHAIKLTTASTDEALRDELNVLFAPPTAHRAAHRRNFGLGPSSHWAAKLPHPHAVRMIGAVQAQMAPLERLRWRSATGNPRPPRRGTSADDRGKHVPQAIWPDWLIRLQPDTGYFADDFSAAMARCLLVPGRVERHVGLISEELQPRHSRLAVTVLARLCRQGHDGVLSVLSELADYLDTNGSPIDYRRRRALTTDNILTGKQWAGFCADAMAHPGQPRRLHQARRYIFTLLTGADLTIAGNTLAYRSPADRSRYLRFTLSMNSAQRNALHEHARAHLTTLGIDEPLTWSPPNSCCAGIVLPGRDPEDIDLHAVRELVRSHHAPGAIAQTLGTSIEHIRYAIARIDQTPDEPPGWLHQHQAREVLSREFFQREYVQAGKTLRDLHSETGYGRTALARHAKRAGIQLRKGPPAIHIDPQWLEEQYTQRRRPFYDIAAELGISGMTVILAARRHGITARPPGLVSHPDLVTVHEHLAPDIRAAVEGQLHGWQRLRRFRDAMNYPSLNIAAPAIGAEIGALVTQIRRLERDIGATLIHRATPHRAMRPTDRGAALLADLHQPDIDALIEKHGQPPRGKRQTP